MNEHPTQAPAPELPPPVQREQPTRRPKSSRRESIQSILSTVSILVLAPLIALFLITFVFQSYLVDGPSMQKTLFNNDRLIVWKLPRTWARITGHDFIPNRGDIVVFTEPNLVQFNEDPGKQIIKRVVGLPGERVVVKEGTVTVYNDDHTNGFQPDVELPYHLTGILSPGDVDVTLKAGQIFVLGDNRTNSLDSPDFGPVEAKDVVGKLVLRLWPIGDAKVF